MRSMEFTGKTVDEAIFHGLNEMGVTIDEVDIETLQDETKGLFGIGAKLARVRLTEREVPLVMDMEELKKDLPVRKEKKEHTRGEKRNRSRRENDGGKGRRPQHVAEEKYEYSRELAEELPAAKFLSEILEKMGIDPNVSAVEADGGYRIRIDTDTDGLLIGRRGETLDALQYIVSLYANHGREDYQRITLDTEGYRARREETLQRLAKKEAAKVLETGRSVVMDAMNPYERRVLHSALQNFEGVTTYSEGEEPNRRVIIAPAQHSIGE